ncbi:threonine dehydratase mitochondrial-related [Holotrichia oblita]|uniref:Threonine dehydratase mitochondrial-related n=1 Tax=Holotrichia oblita TaxID=644536 RepID=A0ACB9SKF4_HOLOL|nr:threonine dehydratase mitochondrial-related [Holotrichia oblita]
MCDCDESVNSSGSNIVEPRALGGLGGDGEIIDPTCDPNNPKKLQFDQIALAYVLLRDGIAKTPCDLAHLSKITGMSVYIKCEFMQHTGSFKERGARFAMLQMSEEQRRRGCVAASAGNHAQAMCLHGLKLGIPITTVMPVIAPLMKIQKCKDMKGNVIVQGENMAEAKAIAMKIARDTGANYVNGYDNPHILAGQGTCGIEILEQVPDVDAIVIPTGGGSLIAGVATAVKTLKPSVKIIGVESECCPGFSTSLAAGKPVTVVSKPSMADGLAVPTVGYNSIETAKGLVDRMILVKEEDIAVGILRLLELEKHIVEGAGATPVAALLSGKLDQFIGKKVVLILSGGNIDTTVLSRALERGLAADGRLIKIYVKVSDRPGGLSELTTLVASAGAVIKLISQERAWVKMDVFSSEVKLVIETRDYAHVDEIKKVLTARYKDVRIEHVEFPASSAINQKFPSAY